MLAFVSAGLAGVLLGAAGLRVVLTPPLAEPPRPIQFDIPVTNSDLNQVELSPDGRYLAYLSRGTSGRIDVMLRELGRPTTIRVAESDVRSWLAWSADGTALLVGTSDGERRVNVRTGSSLVQRWTRVDPPGSVFAGRMALSDGRFLGGALRHVGPLRFISPNGSEAAFGLDGAVGEVGQVYPAVYDRTEGSITYTSVRADGSRFVCVATLVLAKRKCGGPLNHSSAALYRSGQLLYTRDRSLLTRSFDLQRAAFIGEEEVLADDLLLSTLMTGLFSASERGDVAFPVGTRDERLVWVEPTGRETAIQVIESSSNLALALDGRRVLSRPQRELRLLDLVRGGSFPLGPSSGGDPVWAPDGQRFAHRTKAGIVIRSIDDPQEIVVFAGGTTAFPEDWSSDGKWIVAGLADGPYQIVLVPVQGGDSMPFLPRAEAPFSADEMHFSPDRRWLALNGLSGNRDQVFVLPVPPTGQRWQVSSNGGVQARWHPSGKTLYYLEPDGGMMAVDIAPGATFSPGAPKRLFDVGFSPTRGADDYRIGPDGRFLIKKPALGGSPAIRVIINWPALLK